MEERKAINIQLESGTWPSALAFLIRKGLRFGSFIDIGSADGYFGLAFWRAGLFSDMAIVNIDANPLYEPTLRKIRDAIGSDYRICAVDERSGTLELHTSAHPYWASAAPADDPYWKTINGQIGTTTTVPCRTLDSIVEELALKPPYAIKLDIQGLEARALRSGTRTLANTAAVVCEVIIHNFREINAVMEKAGFDLFDLSDIHRTPEQTLGWFYATYLNRNYASPSVESYWADDANATLVEQQQRRRQDLLAKIDSLVAKINAEKGRGG